MGKNYTVKTEVRDDYFYVYVEGNDSFDTSLGYWLEVIELIIQNDYRKVLIEENLIGKISTVETYRLSTKIAESAGKLKACIAFVDQNPSHQSNNSFGETVVTTRGLQIKVFPSIAHAEKWLTKLC